MTDDTASGTPSGTVWARGEGVVLRAARKPKGNATTAASKVPNKAMAKVSSMA